MRALVAGVTLTVGSAVPAAAASVTLSVHGVTAVTTDPDTCDTRVELGFRVDPADHALSNGRIDAASITADTMTVDGEPAAAYGTRTDLGVAPFYFATLDLPAAAPGVHELAVTGGQFGVQWRAFDHANPADEFVAVLDGDYRLAFTVPACGAALPVVFSSFAPPIDDGPTLNLIGRGLTAPIRFSASRGGQALTDAAAFSVSVSRAVCDRTAETDRVERFVQPHGAGQLFYDPLAALFVYRWTAPTGNHPCWDVTIAHRDGEARTARFRTWGER